jgi:type II secretory pathway pseudopilin PulG
MAWPPRRFRLRDLTVGVILVTVALIIFLPGWLASRQQQTEIAALRVFASIHNAEDEVRSNDLDGNGELDYWTRDVQGLSKFRAKGTTVGLIDSDLAAADGAYPDARPRFDHFFRMVERDGAGRPLANTSGCGERLIYGMSPARMGTFKNMWAWDSDSPKLWGRPYEGAPLLQWPHAPAAQGWGIID